MQSDALAEPGRIQRIAHVGWRDSAGDKERSAAVVQALGISDAWHDYVDLREGRDFLLESSQYDVVLLHEVYRYSKPPDRDKERLYAVSAAHTPARWRERLMSCGARTIIAFGGPRHVTWAYLKSLGYTRQSVSRWGCVYAQLEGDINALHRATFPESALHGDDTPTPDRELGPAVLSLFDVIGTADVAWYGSDNIDVAELRDFVVARGRAIHPDAVIKHNLRLPRGVVDIAIIARTVTIGILLHGSDMVFQRPKRGAGTMGFDHVVAIDAAGAGSDIYDRPPHVHVLRPYLADGQMRFRCLRAGWRDVPADPCALLSRYDLAQTRVRGDRHEFIYKYFRKERRPSKRLTGGEIAPALMDHLSKKTPAPAVLIRELSIGAYNSNIADVAVATPSSLDLYEIKGESDGPARLPSQVEAYDAVGNTCTLVLAANKASMVNRVPAHWGIIYATLERGRIRFVQVRTPGHNPNRTPVYVAHFLQTPNLHGICRLRALRSGWRRSAVDDLRAAAASAFPISALTTLATRAIAGRYSEHFRKTTVLHKGDLNSWPSVRRIVTGSDAPQLAVGG